ncbi:MAG: beta-lactamase family protein [Desulfobulbaceae bacterium]|jgi:CubicO group peptidase (beta-lactamase class C family)|nr:beta-lactamase family protein [Desulfobulbaceae bacterium]
MMNRQAIENIFARSQICSALALGVSRQDNGRRETLFLGQASPFGKEFLDAETVFDLASLTKPLVTALATHSLICQEKLAFSDRLSDIFPEVAARPAHPAWRHVTIAQLLSHASGLPAHRPFFIRLLALPQATRQEALISMIVGEKPLYQAGCGHIYSDLGFMLLGCAIERITGETLANFWRRTVAAEIGLPDRLFFSGDEERARRLFAETGVCPWSGQILAGLVHDDNCRALGGVAGHAGLFGTLNGVLAACDWLTLRWHGASGEREQVLLREMCEPTPNSSWCLGFDSPSGADSASGDYFRAASIGHLGFTGTSFWIDMRRRISVVLLTNRTVGLSVQRAASEEERARMKRFRREIHDCVMREFEGRPAVGRP